MLYRLFTFVSMKKYIMALAVVSSLTLASCGSGSTETTTTTVDSTAVVTDTTSVVDTTMNANVADTLKK
jgi:hypothetical protein